MEVVKRCENCKNHYWLNGWKCKLDCWEFQLWIGKCENFEKK